jgi:hypothetical protein
LMSLRLYLARLREEYMPSTLDLPTYYIEGSSPAASWPTFCPASSSVML